MKIWFPRQYTVSEYDGFEDYRLKCASDIFAFKSILQKNLNLSRWNAIKERLIRSNELHFINDKEVSPTMIAQKYIDYLSCYTDTSVNRCYYDVSPLVMCPNTTDSLSRIIRMIEFGFADIEPMNWIRHSYIAFTEYIDGRDKD